MLSAMAWAQCPSGMSAAWTCLDRPGDGSNHEVEIYKPANVTIVGGFLNITEKNTPSVSAAGTYLSLDQPGVGPSPAGAITCSGSGNPGTYSCSGNYSSGMIQWTTFNQQYGDFQIRAKLGYGWPALVLYGSNCQTPNISGPDNVSTCNWDVAGSGELDIAEGGTVGSGSTNIGQNVLESGFTNPLCSPNAGNDITTNFHVYEVIVTSSNTKFYIDGTNTCTMTGNVTDHWYLAINAAIGGDKGGTPSSFSYPNNTVVDWVKVCTSACANGITGAAATNGSTGFNGNGFDDFNGTSSGRILGGGRHIGGGHAIH